MTTVASYADYLRGQGLASNGAGFYMGVAQGVNQAAYTGEHQWTLPTTNDTLFNEAQGNLNKYMAQDKPRSPYNSISDFQGAYNKYKGSQRALNAFAVQVDTLASRGNQAAIQFRNQKLGSGLGPKSSYTPLTDKQITAKVATTLDQILGTVKDNITGSLGLPKGISNEVDQARQLSLRGFINHMSNQPLQELVPITNLRTPSLTGV